MEVKATEIGQNDILVFTHSQKLSEEQFKKFRNSLKGNLERAGLQNHKFIALDASVNLQVIRPSHITSSICASVQDDRNDGHDEPVIGFNMVDFDACARRRTDEVIRQLDGRDCYVGIDCDIYRDEGRSAVILFPDTPAAGYITVLTRPLFEAGKTPGTGTSAKAVQEIANQYAVKGIGCDPAFNSEFIGDLYARGLPVVAILQRWVAVAPAVKLLEQKMHEDRFVHFADPVYREAFSNTVLRVDSVGNRLPHSGKSRGCIGYVYATLNAIIAMNAND